MRKTLCLFLTVSTVLAACSAPPNLPPIKKYGSDDLAASQYKAVLIAGDASAPAFDNAVNGMAERLQQSAIPASDIKRLSAAPDGPGQKGAVPSSLDNLLQAIASMHPAPGKGCIVFATSHGSPRGLRVSATGDTLSPAELDEALARGCGNAPTVAIVSGCFSGDFSEAPMARANRIVLTASRADRPSFGCSVRNRYTVFDGCVLTTLSPGKSWSSVSEAVHACVSAEERRLGYAASDPQTWIGPAVAGMAVPGTRF